MEETTGERHQLPDELFTRLLAQARRMAIRWWLGQALAKGVVWAAVPLAMLTFVRSHLPVNWWVMAAGCGILAMAVTAAMMWRTREIVTHLPKTLDKKLEADGRISGAAEFLAGARDDPFKRLAVLEAGSWMSGHMAREVLWPWPVEVYALIPAAILIYVLYWLT